MTGFAMTHKIMLQSMLWSDVSQNWPNFSDFSSFDKKIPSAVFRLLPTFFFFHISFSVTAETRCISLVSTSYIIHFVTPLLPAELFEGALLINLLPSLPFKTNVSNGIRGLLACLACSCIAYSCFSNASFSTHNTSKSFPFLFICFHSSTSQLLLIYLYAIYFLMLSADVFFLVYSFLLVVIYGSESSPLLYIVLKSFASFCSAVPWCRQTIALNSSSNF